jgi:large subunit ribosomal protein L25
MQILDLPVEARAKLGSADARRYRRAGFVPCILYGGGQQNVPLTTPGSAVEALLGARTRLVRLQLGEEAQTALVREIAWDHLGERVHHIDFVRVEMKDEVKVTVPLHFVGVPVGQGHGGVTEALITDLEVRCRVDSIPEELRVDIHPLDIGQGIHVGELEYPQGVRPARSERDLLIHIVEPRKIEIPEAVKPEEEVPAEEAAEAAAEGEEKKAPPEKKAES